MQSQIVYTFGPSPHMARTLSLYCCDIFTGTIKALRVVQYFRYYMYYVYLRYTGTIGCGKFPVTQMTHKTGFCL